MTVGVTPATLPLDVVEEVRQFLHLEARLLDGERYAEWLALLTDDVHYWAPGIENRARKDPLGTYQLDHMAYFDDTKADLAKRIARLTSDTAWAENPPTRHFHLVSNVEVEAGEDEQHLLAHSVVLVFRARYERDEDVLYGRREDRLRRDDGELRLARRRVLMNHNILPSKNLNTFL